MKKKKIILPNLRYEDAPVVGTSIRVGLEEEKSLLRTDDRDIALDLNKQFATERADCNRYKFYGKLKMIFSNLYLGTSEYSHLKQRLFLEGDGSNSCFAGYLPYNEFAFLRNDVHREGVEGTSVSDLSSFTGFNVSNLNSGSTIHKEITASNSYQFNWNMYLSYISSHDTEYPMKYTVTGVTSPTFDPILDFVSGDGIPFRVAETSSKYILSSPVKHGMSQGEYIFIDNIIIPFYIESVGNTVYRSEEYVLTISKLQVGQYRLNGVVNGRRCTDINNASNTTSEYYVHKHTTLDEITDHIIDKVGFESPIWEDEKKLLFENSVGDNDVIVVRNRMESVLFDHFEPYLLSAITNNLGYQPTDLYTSIIFRNSNGYFEYPPKVGYSFHFHDSWVDEHFSGDAAIEDTIPSEEFTRSVTTFNSGLPITGGTILHGAFVEYDPKEMKERIISETFHKIVSKPDVFYHGQDLSTVYSGTTSINMLGLYYQPHYRFKLRELSPYVETSDTDKIENLPENARYFPDEKLWRWRDLYEDGYIDVDENGTDYPYKNDTHYIHKDINFYLRNEYSYTNKKDGIAEFDNNGTTETCIKSAPGVAENIIIDPTPSVTPSITPTPSVTPSVTPSITASVTPLITSTPSVTASITPSVTPSVTPSITPSPTSCP